MSVLWRGARRAMRPRGAVRRVRMLLAGDTLVDANTGKALTPPLPTAIPATAVVYTDAAGAMHGEPATLAVDANGTVLVGIGLAVLGSSLVLGALPTSAVGLPAGAAWRDVAAGNVVKVVPP